MKECKASDKSGIVVEMLQHAGQGFLSVLTHVFNDILFKNEPPKSWKESSISVMFKKGDATLPENYRPITLLNADYKILAKTTLRDQATRVEYGSGKGKVGIGEGSSRGQVRVNEVAMSPGPPLYIYIYIHIYIHTYIYT